MGETRSSPAIPAADNGAAFVVGAGAAAVVGSIAAGVVVGVLPVVWSVDWFFLVCKTVTA